VRVVVADARCPLVTSADIDAVVDGPADRVRVGVRPVVDTVKIASADGSRVRGTVDRSQLHQVTAPLVLTGGAIDYLQRRLRSGWVFSPLAALVAELDAEIVDLVEVGPLGARVSDDDDVRVLAARRSV
jgi:2-C-methyl-D-erythritol 4-phosphate cytidylyltransferase